MPAADVASNCHTPLCMVKPAGDLTPVQHSKLHKSASHNERTESKARLNALQQSGLGVNTETANMMLVLTITNAFLQTILIEAMILEELLE